MPQQIIQNEVGKHNESLSRYTSQYIQGGTWKKQRVVIVTPAANHIPAKVYLSHCSLILPPNQPAHRMLALGMEVGEAYSNTIEAIINHPELSQWEFILTLEHDNGPPGDGLLQLIRQMEAHPEYSCIGGLYWTKGEAGVPQIWGDPKDPVLNFRPQPPIPGQLVECCGTGMGFNLWRMSMFKDSKLRKPWFKTQAGLDGVGSQDLYAWGDFRKHGYRCAIDCSVLVGHYDEVSDVWW